MVQINDKCFYNEIDNCLVSHKSVSLIEALNLLFNLQIDSNKSIINNNFTRIVASEDKESSREFFAKGFIETLTLLKEQFKIPVVVEDSYNKTSDNWIIKLDNNYKEAYDDYVKGLREVDFSNLKDSKDNIMETQECSGGSCPVI